MLKTKLRAKLKGDVVEAIVLINHPMESGLRVPGNYKRPGRCHHITELRVEHKGNQVFIAHWSGAVARNPFLSFRFRGAARGDKIELSWIDNDGGVGQAHTTIS